MYQFVSAGTKLWIGFGAPRARGIHRRVILIGNQHLVAERLQVSRDPLALRTRLEQDLRPPPIPQHRGEALAARDGPALGDGPVLITEAELSLALVQIQSYHILRRC